MEHEVDELVVLHELLGVALAVPKVAVQSQQQDWRHDVEDEVFDGTVRVKSTHPISILLLPLAVQFWIHLGVRVLAECYFVGGGVKLDGD